ncbi:MAG: deoxyribonuclease V [Sedimenticola sp.]
MFEKLHPWDVSPGEAREIQQQLRGRVITSDRLGKVRHVAGVDVGFEENGRISRAAVVLLSFPGLQPEASAIARRPTRFPYVPGLLSFREIPAVLDALEKLERLPDLLLCDGQGIAHPRRFGIACHLGLLTDIPAIGVAKSRLTGTHGELPPGKGSWVPLMDGDERIGAVLRSRSNVSPLYISPGHKISLETAIDYVLACTPKYRLPETTRRAHRLASG